MLELYFYPSPNCTKITICLEELGLAYQIQRVDIGRGEQFEPGFLALSPNNKVPALRDTGADVELFESGAILLYLAEREERFLGDDPHTRLEVLKWLFWQVGGLGPMAGQAHHFRAFATEEVPYGIRRYTDEVNRLYGVLDRRLADRKWIAGPYSIADMACWPWIAPFERQGQTLDDFPHIARWFRAMQDRSAVARALALGEEEHVPRERYHHLYGQRADRLGSADKKEQP